MIDPREFERLASEWRASEIVQMRAFQAVSDAQSEMARTRAVATAAQKRFEEYCWQHAGMRPGLVAGR